MRVGERVRRKGRREYKSEKEWKEDFFFVLVLSSE